MCCDRTNKDTQEEKKLGREYTKKVHDLKKQVNPYEWVSAVEDSGYLHEYGPELTEGRVSVDHSSFTTIVSIHGGRKATEKYKSVALLDSGSPSSFVTQAVIDEILRKGAVSADMITVGKPRRWGGFTDSTEQLQTNSSACRSVQFLKRKKPMARMKVPCHIVPPMVLQHGLLLGRDSFLKFQNHTYATLPKEAGRPVEGVPTLSQNKEKNVASIQPTNTENDYHLRYVGKDTVSLTSHPRMLMVMLVGADNTPAMTGSYFVQILESWNLNEDAMVVSEGEQSIPLSSHEYSKIPSGALLGTSNGPTLPTTLENTGLQEPVKKSCVATVTKGSQLDEDRGQESDRKEEPPNTLGSHLPAPQRESLKRVWLKLPKHMKEIKYKLGGQGWKPKIIRRLGQVLMEFSARNEPIASIDGSNRTPEEGDTREIDVGTEQIIASKGSTKHGASVRSGNHNLASPDGEEPLIDEIDVGEDATREPNPSQTQQDIPDVSRDARLDVDLGSMTAQTGSQEQLQEPVRKSAMTLLEQDLGGASPHDITLQFPIRVRPTVQQVVQSKYVLFHPTTEDVVKSGIPVDIEKIIGHQLVRGRGGKLAVMYETHWEGLSSITGERESI